MNTLLIRSITGLIFGLIVMGAVLFDFSTMAILFFLVNFLGLFEFYSIIKKNSSIHPQFVSGIFAGSILYIISVGFLIGLFPLKFFAIFLLFTFLIFILEIWRNQPNPIHNTSITLMAISYITLPLVLLLFAACPAFNSFNYNPALIMGFILLIWVNDTGAYIIGVNFGKHRFFERISPKKSWEGFLGGAVTSILAAWGLSFLWSELTFIQWLGIAIIVIIFATLGDLVESMFKRSLNIKDSGTMLPGHGGILDRFDALLGAAPFLFIYIKLIL